MRILTRDIIAVKIVMLGSTKCVCEWETEKGSVLEAKHQQFYMRAHCSNVATTLTSITKMKNSSVCLKKCLTKPYEHLCVGLYVWQLCLPWSVFILGGYPAVWAAKVYPQIAGMVRDNIELPGQQTVLNYRHPRNHLHCKIRKGTEAEMCPVSVSGIVTGHAPVSYWSIFVLSLVTVPQDFAVVNSVQSPSRF